MDGYRHRWPSTRRTISIDDYLHGELSSWMAIFTDPVTVSTDDYLHGSCNHRHGELSAWMAIGTDDHLQDIDRGIDTSC